MENDADDLENLFEEYESPNNLVPNEENVEHTENAENGSEAKAEKVPVPKRIIKNPRLKFNAERLCGERGLPVIVKHFKTVKFKGKGHEKEDLNKLMSSLEHWCHRLYPSMKLVDCLQQIEKLGKKRPVQTCLHKIRLDMPILNSDFVRDDEPDEEVPNNLDPEQSQADEDAFDRLFAESRETPQPDVSPTPPTGMTLGSSFGAVLTEEQRKRMEHSKMLAINRRKSKLAAMQDGASSSTSTVDKLDVQVSESITDPVTSSVSFAQNSESIFPETESESLLQNNEKSENLLPNKLIDVVNKDLVDIVVKDNTLPLSIFPNSESIFTESESLPKEQVQAEDLELDELMDFVNDKESEAEMEEIDKGENN